MFSNAGFQITSDQMVPDDLIDNLVISGNETTIAARLNELLGMDIDELMVSLVPSTGTDEDEQQLAQLMHLIGQL
jgi:ribosomal protein L12E/L44/L45/RPP1/RPP2